MERNIRLLGMQFVMRHALFFVPVLVLYFRDEIGLSFQAFLITEAAFALTIVLFEVPSGWLSDIWQRKYTLLASDSLWIVGMALLLAADSLAWALAAQCTLGIAFSLSSGTNVALLYDTFLAMGKQEEFSRTQGRLSGYAFYSVGASSLLGGFLYAFNHDLVVWLCVATASLSWLSTSLMIEPPRHKTIIQQNPLADMIRTMKYALRENIDVGLIIVFSAALFCATKLIMLSQQPYYVALDIPEGLYGVFYAAGFGLAGLASHLSHRTETWCSNFQALVGFWVLALTACFASAIILGPHGVVLLMMGGALIYGAATPRVHGAINQRVASDRRATILSTQSLLVQLSFVPLSLAVGQSFDAFGIRGVLLGLAIWLIVAGAGLMVWARRRMHESRSVEL